MKSRISVVVFSNTDYTDLRDVSLALGMGICEIPNICGYIFFEHRLHRLTGYTRLRSG